MKAYLKGSDGAYFPLAPKVTTVGCEGCDFIIKTSGVDQQHAVVEYSDQDDSFILQDLNSAQGTYVNDVRVQNAAVRLAPGDIVRFGYSGTPYELRLENSSHQLVYPPVSRGAWSQPMTLMDDSDRNIHGSPSSLPFLGNGTQQPPPTYAWQNTSYAPSQQPQPQQITPQAHIPRPPLRNRPLSAGSAGNGQKKAGYERISSFGSNVTEPSYSPQRSIVGGWTVGPLSSPQKNTVQQNEASFIQEKDQKILHLTEEISRLRLYESETYRKDQNIKYLQDKVSDLHSTLEKNHHSNVNVDADLTQNLLHYEAELTAKRSEIAVLKDQLMHLKSETPNDAPVRLRDELAEKVKEVNNVKNELERIKKDKTYTNGLVTSMQRDMSNKDVSISKLTREVETLKKENKEKDVQLASLSSKLQKLNEPKQEEKDAREKELISLRQKFKAAENKTHEQQETIASLKQELDRSKKQIADEKDAQKKLLGEIETAKSECNDIKRTEQVVRFDLEKATKMLETFRNRVIKVTYSASSVTKPENLLSDDTLVSTLKSLLDERVDYLRKSKDLENEMTSIRVNKNDFNGMMAQLRFQTDQSQKRLQQDGHLTSNINREINMIKSVNADDSLAWVRDAMVEFLTAEMIWENLIEEALRGCGVNLKLSNEGPASHIAMLQKQWETSNLNLERYQSEINTLRQEHGEYVKAEQHKKQEEVAGRVADAVEKTKLEGEIKLNEAIDGIVTAEEEKRNCAVQAERIKIDELHLIIQELRDNVAAKSEETEAKLLEAAEALSQMEGLKDEEIKLQVEIASLQKVKEEEIENLVTENEVKLKEQASSLKGYKEQCKEHSVTICRIQENLTKVNKKNHDFSEEIHRLKNIIHELKSKPLPPPKPKVIVQKSAAEITELEKVIGALRIENVEVKRQLGTEQNIITSLRKDLTGAKARLQDISGEMSEEGKRELEQNREMVSQRNFEVTELRQQLAKLSKIVDKQKEAMNMLESELSKEKVTSAKMKQEIDSRSHKLGQLRDQLDGEKEEQKKQLILLDQEGRITSEMTALGAQCRGERHESVITKQREALAELRSRVRTLEQARPPLPTQDQALQQVIMLKKELAEMRVNQALSDGPMSGSPLDREVSAARGLIPNHNHDADMERSAHRETMEALELSEQSFMRMLREMADSLEVDEIMGLKPMAHIPRDERQILLGEREKSAELVTSRINVLKEQVRRKDDLLQGYERDLAKLRQAQDLSDRKASQLEHLAENISTSAEESQYLRESLNRTRDRLDQEKRLNKAIKEKKTFHLENEQAHIPRGPHRCKPEDPKAALRKRTQRDLLKRKNYEIQSLKTELCRREKSLTERERRILSLQSTLEPDRPLDLIDS